MSARTAQAPDAVAPGESGGSDSATGSTAEAAGQAYKPGRTLGRSGYVPDPASQLATKIRQLDALLCLVTSGDWDASQERDDAPVIEFQSLNFSIQSEVLHLAAALAEEVHELHEQVSCERMGRPQALRAVPEGGAAS